MKNTGYLQFELDFLLLLLLFSISEGLYNDIVSYRILYLMERKILPCVFYFYLSPNI